MKNRIEIEKVENGFQIDTWEESEESGETMMYPEAKKYVAESLEEVMKIIEKKFK